MSEHAAPNSGEQNSVKVSVSTTSVSTEIKGPAAKRAGESLADLVSPFTQAMGFVGDQIAHARAQAAIRAVKRAREILAEEDIQVGNIPPKILLPWLEGASLETEEETNSLTEAWAGLFARAVKSSDAVVVSYIETLKKLGKAEAGLLDFFVTDRMPDSGRLFYWREDIGIFSDENMARYDLIKRTLSILEKEFEVAKIDKYFDDFGFQGMCRVVSYWSERTGNRITPYFRENEHAVSNLEHLGLIDVKEKTFSDGDASFYIVWFNVTKYAFDMIYACRGVTTSAVPKRSKVESE